MSSANLELFPDDLFARKGTATPAGGETKETPDQTVVSLDGAAGTRQAPKPPETQDDPAAEPKAPAKAKSRKRKAKGRKSGGDAAESEPAASVLKFRLLDEASQDLDEILRCAEGSAAAEAEPAEPEPEAPSEPAAETEAAIPAPVAVPARSAARPSFMMVLTIALIVAAGLYAAWYLSNRDGDAVAPEGDVKAEQPLVAPDEAPVGAQESEAGDPAAAEGEPAPQNALKARESTDAAAQRAPEIKPTVDVVRIEDDGSTLIAGAAGPNAELIVLHNGEPIGVAKADSLGQWILLPESPLGPGPHEFGLVIKDVEGAVSLPAPDPAEADAPAGAAPQSEPEESEAPDSGASGGEAGAAPAPGAQESHLPAPEADPAAASSEAESLTADGYPLPLQKPAPASSAIDGQQDGSPRAPYIVQFASTPSAQGAAWEWERLQKSFPELLSEHEPEIQEAELTGVGTVFRLRAGAFDKLSEARGFCAAFRERRQDCLVVKLPDATAAEPRLAETQ